MVRDGKRLGEAAVVSGPAAEHDPGEVYELAVERV